MVPSPRSAWGQGVSSGWLELSVDMGDLQNEELSKILAAYSQKKNITGEKRTVPEAWKGGLYAVGPDGLRPWNQPEKELQKGSSNSCLPRPVPGPPDEGKVQGWHITGTRC